VRRICSLLVTSLWLALLAASAHAETPSCEALTGYRKILAAEFLASQRPYDCCDESIAKCLEQKPTCSLAFRLAENICRRIADRQPQDRIIASLQERARSMSEAGRKASIDLTGLAVAGDAEAPITLVEYGCPRCPYCARITVDIHDAFVTGRLKGKAKLYLKTFPIRGHPYVTESGLAFLAAQKLEHFWEFVLHFYQRFDLFSLSNQLAWAEAVGMDRGAFESAMADPATRESLVEIKKEGLANGIQGTPTFFINGRQYHGDITPEELIDVLEEEFERIEGIRYRPVEPGGGEPTTIPGDAQARPQKAHRTIPRAEARKLIEENAGNPDFVILDIRTASEFQEGHLRDAVNSVDFGSTSLERDLEKLDKNKTYLIYCDTGNRSDLALMTFEAKRFKRVYDLRGGIKGWTEAGFEVVTK
jgi:rhodanese-related sulfurtransferase/protein-disulfide isomerase